MPFAEALLLHYIYTTQILQECQGYTTNFFSRERGQDHVIALWLSITGFQGISSMHL
ncbi:hypothetical protein NIES3275_06930 [Microchaete diplosiphon NIES-3275]|nr:hypothetical protein NIES3275_06930 [Microchaete diplosiphon NIES-3275]